MSQPVTATPKTHVYAQGRVLRVQEQAVAWLRRLRISHQSTANDATSTRLYPTDAEINAPSLAALVTAHTAGSC